MDLLKKYIFFISILMLNVSFVFGTNLLNWNSQKSIEQLSESNFKVDYFILSNHFESQITKAYCGIASAVIILNSIKNKSKDLPLTLYRLDQENEYDKKLYFKRYSQTNILKATKKTAKMINSIPDPGLQLHQLQDLLKHHNLKVTKRVINSSLKLKKMRAELKKNLSNPGDYVIINYDRQVLNQKGGGHISPIAAYHEPSDSFLILDVNPNKAP